MFGTPLAPPAQIIPVGATASDTYSPSYSPAQAIDGNPATFWSAGRMTSAASPVWIQLDLGRDTTVAEIDLHVTQSPSGSTTHEIWGGPAIDRLVRIASMSGNTADGDTLKLQSADLSSSEGIRYLRVLTTRSPSWVGWSEIRVLGSQ